MRIGGKDGTAEEPADGRRGARDYRRQLLNKSIINTMDIVHCLSGDSSESESK